MVCIIGKQLFVKEKEINFSQYLYKKSSMGWMGALACLLAFFYVGLNVDLGTLISCILS